MHHIHYIIYALFRNVLFSLNYYISLFNEFFQKKYILYLLLNIYLLACNYLFHIYILLKLNKT